MMNPVGWFDIPVSDLKRATTFYEEVFGYKLEYGTLDDREMAFFPMDKKEHGAGGALVKWKEYKTSPVGTVIYFQVKDIPTSLDKVVKAGGKVVYGEKSIAPWGKIAEFKDSEGNNVALHTD